MNSSSRSETRHLTIARDLDAKDLAIIETLQDDGRVPLAELGRKIGLSQPAMSERVRRLEERGIIAGYGARINLAALGLNMMAIIRLKTAHEHIRACMKQFDELRPRKDTTSRSSRRLHGAPLAHRRRPMIARFRRESPSIS